MNNPTAPLAPLSDDHYDLCNKVCQSVPLGLDLAQKCAACGLDMTHEIRQLTEQKQRADTIKSVFFPGRP